MSQADNQMDEQAQKSFQILPKTFLQTTNPTSITFVWGVAYILGNDLRRFWAETSSYSDYLFRTLDNVTVHSISEKLIPHPNFI